MKMKKKVLSAGVLTALCMGSAQAVNVSTDGMGQVGIVPFYTVRADNQGNAQKTLISIVNKTDEHKAIKVRVREARNSREVLDFNLYLSPFDVWTGALQDGVTGPIVNEDGMGTSMVTGPGLVTSDTSCTVPHFYDQDGDGKGKTAMFTSHAYKEYRNGITASGERYDGGVSGDEHVNERMYEGYIESLKWAWRILLHPYGIGLGMHLLWLKILMVTISPSLQQAATVLPTQITQIKASRTPVMV